MLPDGMLAVRKASHMATPMANIEDRGKFASISTADTVRLQIADSQLMRSVGRHGSKRSRLNNCRAYMAAAAAPISAEFPGLAPFVQGSRRSAST